MAEPLLAPSFPVGFVRHEKIGEGAYAKVYRAEHVATKMDVAMKANKVSPLAGIDGAALREIAVLRLLGNHNHIVGLRDVDFESVPDKIYTILDLHLTDLMCQKGLVEAETNIHRIRVRSI